MNQPTSIGVQKWCWSCKLTKSILTDFHYKTSTCKVCQKAWFRDVYYPRKKESILQRNEAWRIAHPARVNATMAKRRVKTPEANRARVAVRNAIVAVKFTQKPCEECENPKADFHHTNGYTKENTFVGKWLCRPHHAREHKRLRDLARTISSDKK